MPNRNQGASPPSEQFGPTQQTTAQEGNVLRRMRLFSAGIGVDRPRAFVNTLTTDGSGVAVFYLTDDATDTGADIFSTYEQITARVNSNVKLYAVGWLRTGHTVTVTVKEVTVVAVALDFTTAAAGVAVALQVVGGA